MPDPVGVQIRANNHSDVGLDVYQHEVVAIWPQLKARPALQTWLQVVEHATGACEGVRRGDWRVVLDEIGKTIVWWLAFIEKLNQLVGEDDTDDVVFALPMTAPEIVWSKYPGVCPVEFGLARKEVPTPNTWDDRPAKLCTCMSRKKLVEARSEEEKLAAKAAVRAFSQVHHEKRPPSISQMEQMLIETFASPKEVLHVEEISLHFIEEVGEVSKALAQATMSQVAATRPLNVEAFRLERIRKVSGIAEELADVFSWAITFIAKLKSQLLSFDTYFDAQEEERLRNMRAIMSGAKEINVADIIWRRYGRDGALRCDVCERRPCACPEQEELPLFGNRLTADIKVALAQSS